MLQISGSISDQWIESESKKNFASRSLDVWSMAILCVQFNQVGILLTIKRCARGNWLIIILFSTLKSFLSCSVLRACDQTAVVAYVFGNCV